MAMTGTLGANFSAFYDAVIKAEVHLKSFETGAGKVEGSLNRMVDSFSGRKILSEATIATEAVERIGGASKLTEAEQRKVNATVTEALAKYAALGQSAPAAMVALAAATKQTEVVTAGLSTSMVALGSFIGTMAANAVTALARMAADGLKAVARGIVELVMQGPKISGIENSFHTLAESVNASGAAMLGAMRTGTRGLVTDLDLMTAANKAVLLGLPVTAKEMGDLSATATILGRAMGLGPTQAFGDLVTALGRSSPLILDNLGLTVKVGEANATYAAHLGKAADKLTEAEQKTAFYNAALEAARAKVEALGQQQNSLGDSIARTGIWWDNFKDNLSVAIARSPVLAAGMDSLGTSFGAAFGADKSALVQTLSGYVNKFGIFLVDVAQIAIESARFIANSFLGLQSAFNAVMGWAAELVTGFNDLQIKAIEAVRSMTLPSLRGPADEMIATLKGVQDFAKGVGESFLRSSSESLDAAAEINKGLDSTQTALGVTRAAMLAAMIATTSLSGATDTVTAATVSATAATEALGDAVVEATESGIVYGDAMVTAAQATEVAAVEMGNTWVEQYRRAQEAAEALRRATELLAEVERKRVLASRQLGGAYDVTSQNFEQALQSIATSGGWNPSGMGSNIDMTRAFTYARQGYSMQEIVSIFARERAGGSGPVPPPHGPRIPGFAGGISNFGGGWAMVGEQGPEPMYVPQGASIYPHGSLPGYAGGVGIGGGVADWDAERLAADQRRLDEFMKMLLPSLVAIDRQQALVDLLIAQVAADKAHGMITAASQANERALAAAVAAMKVSADVEKYRADMAAQMGLLAAKVEYDKAQIQAKVDLASLSVVAVRDEMKARGPSVVVNMTVGTVLSTERDLARYIEKVMTDWARSQGQRLGGPH